MLLSRDCKTKREEKEATVEDLELPREEEERATTRAVVERRREEGQTTEEEVAEEIYESDFEDESTTIKEEITEG